MEFSRRQAIKITVVMIFLCCTFFANFIAIRMIMRSGVDAYFYDKLLVAYTIGGAEGLKIELGKITLTDKSPRETILAKDFTARLGRLTDPEAFLNDKVQKNKQAISQVRNLRSLAILFMLILFGWQLIAKASARKRKKLT